MAYGSVWKVDIIRQQKQKSASEQQHYWTAGWRIRREKDNKVIPEVIPIA